MVDFQRDVTSVTPLVVVPGAQPALFSKPLEVGRRNRLESGPEYIRVEPRGGQAGRRFLTHTDSDTLLRFKPLARHVAVRRNLKFDRHLMKSEYAKAMQAESLRSTEPVAASAAIR